MNILEERGILRVTCVSVIYHLLAAFLIRRGPLQFIKNKQNPVGLEIDGTSVHLSCCCLLPVIVPFHAVVWPEEFLFLKRQRMRLGSGWRGQRWCGRGGAARFGPASCHRESGSSSATLGWLRGCNAGHHARGTMHGTERGSFKPSVLWKLSGKSIEIVWSESEASPFRFFYAGPLMLC